MVNLQYFNRKIRKKSLLSACLALLKKVNQKMKNLKHATSIKLESATDFSVLCSRKSTEEVYGIMTQNLSDFSTAVGGKLRSKKREWDSLPSPSASLSRRLCWDISTLPTAVPGFTLSLPVLESVGDAVHVVEDFCSHPLLRDLIPVSRHVGTDRTHRDLRALV